MTQPKYTASTKRVFLPKRGHFAHFIDRKAMKKGHPQRSFKLPPVPMPPSLPIDWTKGGALQFPMYGNDTYGDCMEAAAAHADGTFTGNSGTENIFDVNALEQQYLAASGGDNGLDEGTLLNQCWKPGLGGNPQATILDSLDIDVTNPQLVQVAINLFGGVLFMLDVPDDWVNNFNTGVVWDAPATADQNNGHGVWWNGVDANGNYEIQTWGSYCWITPAGVKVCDPSGFIVFSLRWFNAQGIAPNGMNYDQLAALWVQCGGNALPPSPFVPPPPAPAPTPTPQPTPTPGPNPMPPIPNIEQFAQSIIDDFFATLIQDAGSDQLLVVTLQDLQAAIDAQLPILFGNLGNDIAGYLQSRLSAVLASWEQKASAHQFLVYRKNDALAKVRGAMGVGGLPPGTILGVLQWLLANAPTILQTVQSIIGLFGGGSASVKRAA